MNVVSPLTFELDQYSYKSKTHLNLADFPEEAFTKPTVQGRIHGGHKAKAVIPYQIFYQITGGDGGQL